MDNRELLAAYEQVVGADVIGQLLQIASSLKHTKVLHINATKSGGGVAEILEKMNPLTRALNISSDWEIIYGTPEFYQCTKMFHNAIQGHTIIDYSLKKHFDVYLEVTRQNVEKLRPKIEEADIVIIHDPQPAALISHFPGRKNKWIWRCHIDAASPDRRVWKFLREYIKLYDASIFSVAEFAQPLPHPIYLIPPSIDPLSEKNREMRPEEIAEVSTRFGIDATRPMVLQVSRFDRFKDPIGVIQAYRLAKKFKPGLQLVLAGGGASDDPEGEAVLKEVHQLADGDPQIHVLFLPADSHTEINALQRAADIVLQKSIREGFGLTVTEALWKGRPVIGGNTGGIRLQVIDHHTGFLVNTPEGAAQRIRYLLEEPLKRERMGHEGHLFVKDHFLLTRHLREYLSLFVTLMHNGGNRLELNGIGYAAAQ